MNILKITDETRRFIGDNLLGVGGKTYPISGLALHTGISRPTLTKWTQDPVELYRLTAHISDAELAKNHGRRYYTKDSRFFDHCQVRVECVKVIRADALAGEFGPALQRAEERRRAKDPTATPAAK